MQYLARITIHNGTFQDYEALHKQMLRIGFKRTIKSDAGHLYALPDATYEADSTADINSVHAAVKAAAVSAAPHRQQPQVLVVKYEAALWSGLPLAK
ncbi:hypothetical protein [Cupriavidus basilensis]|uniref:hypothetical protein n=1 Tax=Cupriavidus basilensis TaxID=68895 RepID=UPI0020A68534|nr:hypothetical protein [Cupriavidus basilensis]MCP3022324.1 hypothetical protein [Cupriavidus basilensis]